MSRAIQWAIALLVPALLVFLVEDHILFWDTIQFAGKHAHWYYDQRFSFLLLPTGIDSGHPPVFGMYIALTWVWFGKSLAVTHWAMYPLLVGIFWQLLRLARQHCRHISPYWLVLLVVIDPVLLGQMVLVSPDVMLIFFFLLGLNAVLQKQTSRQTIAMLGAAAVSTRGMMVVIGLFFYELWLRWPLWRQQPLAGVVKITLPYLPSGLFALAFLTYHYVQTGWIGYHPDSPWAYGFERVDVAGLIRNLAILAWRWLDYGRFALWVVLFWMLYQYSGRRSQLLKHARSAVEGKFMMLSVILMVFLGVSFLSFRGLNAHRYLLPVFMLFTVTIVLMIDRWLSRKKRRFCLIFIFVALLSGHLWVYPDRIAQGWDATLAHLPYYQLREDMLLYLQERRISPDLVGTAFPDIGPMRFRDMSDRNFGFHRKDLAIDSLVLYSNIMNDFTDEERDILQQHWIEEVRLQKGGIKMILYRKP